MHGPHIIVGITSSLRESSLMNTPIRCLYDSGAPASKSSWCATFASLLHDSSMMRMDVGLAVA